MKTYLVGGAVRDVLLGRAVQDRDWVVVGSTPEQMVREGFVPVGRDFPVFLHPHTKEEYALARTERKTAPGYRGFVVHAAPEVTLEEDLARRDITINSIAVPAHCVRADGTFNAKDTIDPFRGTEDLKRGVLRHTSQAFVEDPVRILRVARFAARFDGFGVAPETEDLMRQMVQGGEVDHLVPERVWQELATGLMEQLPSRMFDTLRSCGALARLLPEVDRLWGVPQVAEHHPEVDTGVHVMMVLNTAAQVGADLPVRFSALTHDLGKGTTPADLLPRHHGHEERSIRLLNDVCTRLRVPIECAELARVVAGEHGNIHRSLSLNAKATLRLLERCDALRRPERFGEALLACECDARGRLGLQDRPYPQRARLAGALARAQAVVTSVIAAQALAAGLSGQKIGELIASARVAAIAEGLDP